jgi:isopentenyl-diphosphate Delta-isomerase
VSKDDLSAFVQRKQEHISLALSEDNQASESYSLDKISLVHEALPDLDFADLTLETTRLGNKVSKPFLVSAMTAGHEHAAKINKNLLEACALSGWAFAVGSQRRELIDNNAAKSWQFMRASSHQVEVFANIGAAQIITHDIKAILALVDNLGASALIVHCNPLQECIQQEGTPNFRGVFDALAKLIKASEVPIIVKETGCGFAAPTMQRLANLGIAALDVSGLGGTHWGRIEGARTAHYDERKVASTVFANWGISTLDSIIMLKNLNLSLEFWGSGGIRSGLDAAKVLAIGASTVGFAKLLLAPALVSAAEVFTTMQTIEYSLKVAMFCTGSANIGDLSTKFNIKV